MNRFIPPFIASFLTLGVVTVQAKPVSERFICDAKDDLIATVYNDPFYSEPRNHKKRPANHEDPSLRRRLPEKRLAGLILNKQMKNQKWRRNLTTSLVRTIRKSPVL